MLFFLTIVHTYINTHTKFTTPYTVLYLSLTFGHDCNRRDDPYDSF